MANTFKVITKAGVTSADVIYTVAGSTTTVILGLVLGNTTASQINATVTLSSNTSARAGNNDEANQFFEENLSIEVKIVSKKSAIVEDLVELNLSELLLIIKN